MEFDALGVNRPDYYIIEADSLVYWHEQISQLVKASFVAPMTVVFDYYKHLEMCNHFYGNLGLRSPSHFMAQLLDQYCVALLGRKLTAQEERRLAIGLAFSDIQHRFQNKGHPLSPSKVSAYHYDVLHAYFNVSALKWKATLFSKYPEMGFGLIGFMGHKRSNAYGKVPTRVGMLLTDATMRKMMIALPPLQSLYFLKDFLFELQGAVGDTYANYLLLLGARYWMRETWISCFDFIHEASNQGICMMDPECRAMLSTKLAGNIQGIMSQLQKASYAINPHYFEGNGSRQLVGLLCRVAVSRLLFQEYLPGLTLNARIEASIAYIKHYQRALHPDMQYFILQCCVNTVMPAEDYASCPASPVENSVLDSDDDSEQNKRTPVDDQEYALFFKSRFQGPLHGRYHSACTI